MGREHIERAAGRQLMCVTAVCSKPRTPDIGTKSRCVVFRSFDPENAFRVRGFCQCDALHTQRLVTRSRRKTSQYFEETIGMSGGLKPLRWPELAQFQIQAR